MTFSDKPTIFLDFDGCCNSTAWYHTEQAKEDRIKYASIVDSKMYRLKDIDPRAVEYLNQIWDWNFVVSSTWRKFMSLELINEMFKIRGFKGEFIDKTPILNFPGAVRGNEIYEWCNKNYPELNHSRKMVILDDDSDFLLWQRENYIYVDNYYGLSPNHIYKAKRFTGCT